MGVNIPTVFQRFLRGNDVTRARAGIRSGVIFASTEDVLTLVHRPNLTVRDVCVEAATKLGISPLALDFFTLVSEDHQHFLKPDKLLSELDCKSIYHFKLCFKACCASVLLELNCAGAYEYYFHQCRKDFLEGRVEFSGEKKKKECLLKLIILEIVYKAKKKGVKPKTVLDNPKSYGIQSLLNRGFLQEYPRKEVKGFLFERFSKFELDEDRIKVEYLHTIEKSNDFFVHKMVVKKLYQSSTAGPKGTTETKFDLFISPQFGIKKKKKDQDEDYPEEIVKEFEEVISLDIDPSTNTKVTISRKDARPEILYTESPEGAHSLVTCIEGYYRLLVNQYTNLTRANCAKTLPNDSGETMMDRTTRVTVHGPIDRKHAADLLDQEGRENGLYLIRKKRETHGVFVLSLCYELEVRNYTILCYDGKLGFTAQQPHFEDLRSFVEYYTNSKGGLPVCLGRQCQPKLEGFDALLADQQQPPVPLTPRPNKPARFYEVNFQELKNIVNIEAGEFGMVSRALRETRDFVNVALRKLKKPVGLEEELYRNIRNFAELLNEYVIHVYGVSTTPNEIYLVTEFAERGRLDKFILEESNKSLKKARVISYANQIAQGMLFLHTKDITHGRLSAHNVLVMDEDLVKISDAGLHQLITTTGEDNTSDEQQTTSRYGYCWYSPLTLQSNTFDKANDIWAFGVTLWELFAMKKPFHRDQGSPLSKEEVMRFYLKQQYLDPDRPGFPQEIAQLIKKCWLPKPEERLSFKDIVIEFYGIETESTASVTCDDDILYPPDGKFREFWDDVPEAHLELEPRTKVNSFGQVVETEYSCLAGVNSHDEPIPPINSKDPPTVLSVYKKKSVSRVMSCPHSGVQPEWKNTGLPRCYSCPPALGGGRAKNKDPCVVPVSLNRDSHDEYVALQNERSQQNVSGSYVLSCAAQTQDYSQIGEQSSVLFNHTVDEDVRYVESPFGGNREVKPNSNALSIHTEDQDTCIDDGQDDPSDVAGSFSSSSLDDEAMMSCRFHLEDGKAVEAEQPIMPEGQIPRPDPTLINLTNDLPDTIPVADHPYANQPSYLVIGRDRGSKTTTEQLQATIHSSTQNTQIHSVQEPPNLDDTSENRQYSQQVGDNAKYALPPSGQDPSTSHNSTTNGPGGYGATSHTFAQNGQQPYERHQAAQYDSSQVLPHEFRDFHPERPTGQYDQRPASASHESLIGESDKAMQFLGALTNGRLLQDVPELLPVYTDEVPGPGMAAEIEGSERAFPSLTSEEGEDHLAQTAPECTPDDFLASLIDGRSSAGVSSTLIPTTADCAPVFPAKHEDFPDDEDSCGEAEGNMRQVTSFERTPFAEPETMDESQEPLERLDGSRELVARGVAGYPANHKTVPTGEQVPCIPSECAAHTDDMEDPALSEDGIMAGLSFGNLVGIPEVPCFKSAGEQVSSYKLSVSSETSGLSVQTSDSHPDGPALSEDDIMAGLNLGVHTDVPTTPVMPEISADDEVSDVSPYKPCVSNETSDLSAQTSESHAEDGLVVSEDGIMAGLSLGIRTEPSARSLPPDVLAGEQVSPYEPSISSETSECPAQASDSNVEDGLAESEDVGIRPVAPEVSADEQASPYKPSVSSETSEQVTAQTCDSYVEDGPALSEECIMAGLSLKTSANLPAASVVPLVSSQYPDEEEKCEICGNSDAVKFDKRVQNLQEAPSNPDKVIFNTSIEFNGHTARDAVNIPLQTFPSASPVDTFEKCDRERVSQASDECGASATKTSKSPSMSANKGYHQLASQGVPSIPEARVSTTNVRLPSNFPILPIEQQTKLVNIQRKISNITHPSSPTDVSSTPHFQLDRDNIPANLKIKYHDLRFGKVLGRGNFGEVKMGTIVTYKKGIEKREDVAVKVLKKSVAEVDRENFQKEAWNMIRVAAGVKNKYIIRLRGISFDEENDQELMLITELAPKGSLENYLKKHKEHLHAGQLLLFSSQIAEGMAYLAAKKVIHRDLAARNILVAREDLVKISDFGLSRLYSYYQSKGVSKVPIKWYPLESLVDEKFSTKSDVWSFGVTMWEMFSYGEKPYPDLTGNQVVPYLQDGKRLPQPDGCPDKIYKVMERCWEKDYKARPAFFMLHTVILSGLQKEFPNCG